MQSLDDEEGRRLLSPGWPRSSIYSVSEFQDEPITPASEGPNSANSLQPQQPSPRPPGYHPSTVITADVDLPPGYEEVTAQRGQELPQVVGLTAGLRPPAGPDNVQESLFMKDRSTGNEYYIDKRLDKDPKLLEQAVRYWAIIPPRLYMSVKGTHTETIHRSKHKTEHKTVTDFHVEVEITPYLYRSPDLLVSMCSPRTVDNHEKVRRGTCMKQYAPNYHEHRSRNRNNGGHGRIELGDNDNEAANDTSRKPSLAKWCHHYCASSASFKTFQVKRHVVGLNTGLLEDRLQMLVRNTNYRGNIHIDFPMKDHIVELHNDCAINRWRLTTWVRMLFYVTLLFLFTWPWLFFSTKRFEVVVVDWPFSRYHEDQDALEYVSITEDQLFNLWGRAIHHAVLSKRACTLDQQDLTAAEGRPVVQTGNEVFDGLIGTSIRAMNEVNRQLGWGRNS